MGNDFVNLKNILFPTIKFAQTTGDQTKGLQHLGSVSINVGQPGARPAERE